jgi:rhodanese-related sulfurtransferase
MKNLFIFILFVFFSFSSISQEVKNDILSVQNFNELVVGRDVQLVDVRTKKEFDSGKIEGAINIDFFEKDNFITAFEKLNKNQPVYLYCRSGRRSQASAILPEDIGFKEIHDLKGGFIAWTKQ